MGLWSRIAGVFRQKSLGTIEDWFSEFGWGNRTATGLTVTQISAMQVAAVMSCVSILSEDVTKLPVHVYRQLDNGGKKIAADHPLEPLLQRPNGWQSRFEFWEQMMAALLLRGNAYAPIIRDWRGKPIAFVPVNPDQVFLYEAQDGQIFYQVSRRGLHDMAVLESLPLMIPAEDMLHIRWMSFNSLWGVSRIGLAKEGIALSLAQQELAGRLAGNSTNLGGILTTDQKLTPGAAERMKKDWQEKKAGLVNAGEMAVLEMGLKWQPMGMTAQAAEFIASRQFQVIEIARMFRMPPHKLGVMDRGMGPSIEQLDQDYMNNTVSSYLSRIEAKLEQHFDLDDAGVFVEFDVSKFLRASMQTRFNAYRTGIIGMFITPNEARRAEGMPDIDGGDKLYQPTNVAPLGFTPTGQESGLGSDATGAAAPGGAGDPAAVPDDESPEG